MIGPVVIIAGGQVVTGHEMIALLLVAGLLVATAIGTVIGRAITK
jgi:hypothetical protein